jgi:hypothetical protein
MSDDANADRNVKLKATIPQKETPLNKGPAQVPCGQPQVKNVTRYTSRGGHPYGDKR